MVDLIDENCNQCGKSPAESPRRLIHIVEDSVVVMDRLAAKCIACAEYNYKSRLNEVIGISEVGEGS